MLRKRVLVEFTIEAAEDDYTLESLDESIDKLIEFLNVTSLYIVDKVDTREVKTLTS